MAESKHGMSQESQYSSGGVATAVKDKAKDITKDITSSASDMAQQAKDKAQEWASTASTKIDSARSTVGGGLESAAHQIRDKGPREGLFGSTTSNLAEGVESAGAYLREHDFTEMGKDMSNLIRRYPIQSLLVGIGVGFLLARSTSTRS